MGERGEYCLAEIQTQKNESSAPTIHAEIHIPNSSIIESVEGRGFG